MDIYLLARTLKKFEPKSKENITQEYANDIIIIAGDIHIKNYVDFYKSKDIGGNILFHDENDTRYVQNPIDVLNKYYKI